MMASLIGVDEAERDGEGNKMGKKNGIPILSNIKILDSLLHWSVHLKRNNFFSLNSFYRNISYSSMSFSVPCNATK